MSNLVERDVISPLLPFRPFCSQIGGWLKGQRKGRGPQIFFNVFFVLLKSELKSIVFNIFINLHDSVRNLLLLINYNYL